MNQQEAKNIKLSENFTLWEFLKSDKAATYNLMDKQLAIDSKKVVNLAELCKYILQPARKYLKQSINIDSGYRCPELNEITNGSSKTSDHQKGYCADITTERLEDLFVYIRDNCTFDQLIYYKNRHFIHVSYKRDGNRKKIILK